MLFDLLAYAANGIMRRMLRSTLTVIGIVIGIVAIVVLISLGQGVSKAVNDQLESFNPNIVIVVPGKIGAGGGGGGGVLPPSSGKLYENDLARLQKLEVINIITPAITGRVSIQFKNLSAAVSMTGIEPKNYRQSNSGLEVSTGRFLEDNDKQVLVIGSKVAKDTFRNKELAVGSVVSVQGRPFRVVGILQSKGASTFDDTDSTIYVPIDDMRELLKSTLAPHEVSGIYIELKEDADLLEAQDEIKAQLRAAHRVKEDDEDFSLITQAFVKERIGTITTMLTLFLGGLASISLVVGGVTVANTMFASVLERYKEIGTLKAIGAPRSAIFTIFLAEAIGLSILGGLIGSAIAAVILLVLQFFGAPIWLSFELFALAIVFSTVVGVISGFSPALRASRLEVVDAMR